MQQYDTVVLRLTSRTRTDEEALTDLLNERARSGWRFHSLTALGTTRAIVVFSRDTT